MVISFEWRETTHTHTAIETVFELLPPGYCKTAILFHSHTFHKGILGVTENFFHDDDDDDFDSEDY